MSQRPNILLVMSDQHNAHCVGVNGNDTVRTETLDSLAANGVNFTGAYCNNPICGPSRLCIHSGSYCHDHGHLGNNLMDYPEGNSNTLGATVRRYGYQTALIGKGHMIREWNDEAFEYVRYCDLCDADRKDPLTCHYFEYLVENGLGDLYENGSAPPDDRSSQHGERPSTLPYEHSLEHWTGERTLRFLRSRDERRPFFCTMSFQRPHAPLTPAEQHWDRYSPEDIELPESAVDYFERDFAGKPQFMQERLAGGCSYPLADKDPARLKRAIASYYTIIQAIDEEIGRVVEYLRQTGQIDNTVIIYTADHGDFAGEHGLFHKNLGIYESIHRVPMIWHYPGAPVAMATDAIVESVDIMPTLLEMADVSCPESVKGRSLLPVIEGTADGKAEAICEWGTGRTFAIRTERFRLVHHGRDSIGELYDHETDPGEIDNLWEDPDYAGTKAELLNRLLERVGMFSAKTSPQTDREISAKTRLTPTRLLHKRHRTWSDVAPLYQDCLMPVTA